MLFFQLVQAVAIKSACIIAVVVFSKKVTFSIIDFIKLVLIYKCENQISFLSMKSPGSFSTPECSNSVASIQ